MQEWKSCSLSMLLNLLQCEIILDVVIFHEISSRANINDVVELDCQNY